MRLLVVIVALALAPAAHAWTRPSLLLSGDNSALLDTVVRADGTLRAAVVKPGIGLGLLDPPGRPLVVARPPAGVGQVALAADGSGVGMDYRNDAVVAFDAAGALQPGLAGIDGEAAVAVAPNGTAVAAWVAKMAQGYEIDAAFRDPGSAAFGAPVRAGYATAKRTLVYAGIGDSGEAVVAWQSNGFPSGVAAAVRLPGGGFSRAVFVTHEAGDAKLAVGPGGQAILAASRGAGLDVSVKPPGADTMPAAQRIDRGQGVALDVAAAGPRAVAAAWVASPRLPGRARVRVYAGDAALRRVGSVGRDAGGETVRVAVDASGAMVVAWEEVLKAKRGDTTGRAHLGAAYRPPGARFGAPAYFGPVSLDDSPLAVELGPGGRAWVLYEAFQPNEAPGNAYRRVYLTERTP